jgi:hypothetical protein
MEYFVEFQHMPKGHDRPLDEGETMPIKMDQNSFGMIPAVGDYVSIQGIVGGKTVKSFAGKVRSRLFSFIRADELRTCTINIVVEDDDDDWGKLIKE